MPKKYLRKIVVDGIEYKWMLGKFNGDGDGGMGFKVWKDKKLVLEEYSWNAYEDGFEWPETWPQEITPKFIAERIKAKLSKSGDGFYFTLELTESEHSFVRSDIREYCKSNDLELIYYRKFKTGHEPCWREVKVRGNIGKFKDWLKKNHISIENHNSPAKPITKKETVMELKNGSKIVAAKGNPSEIRGYRADVFMIDDSNFMGGAK